MKKVWLRWAALAVALVAICAIIGVGAASRRNESQRQFLEKAAALKARIVTEATAAALPRTPAGDAGYAVFFSVCDGTSRAKVCGGTGKSLPSAWSAAERRATKMLKKGTPAPRWVRADVVSNSWPVTENSIADELYGTLSGFDFNGLALDARYDTALLEGELNGAAIYDYKNDVLSMERLNQYLTETGRRAVDALPAETRAFECWGWLCDEDGEVYELLRDGPDNGRRRLEHIDGDYARSVIENASAFLVDQVREDGSFIYALKPQFDEEDGRYNMLRHSGTIWSLICRYRMLPDDGLREIIERTIDYMLDQIIYDENGAGFLNDFEDEELKLGGNGIAVVALTEYMDVFQDDRYREASVALGEGILSQQDPETGSYWHVLNTDFTHKDEFRTIYYDGECTFALTRLYSLTGEQKWLDAACLAIEHFIKEDYTQYRDHWVAYSLDEVTKYVDRQDFYDFALANAVNNYARIKDRPRTYPTNLELLMASFETWQRMVEKGIDTGDFEVKDLLNVILERADRQLSGYFYPEFAMYMANPQRVLWSFMARNENFRVRIDDVQHNIGGFYLYWKNYDAMVAAGLDPTLSK